MVTSAQLCHSNILRKKKRESTTAMLTFLCQILPPLSENPLFIVLYEGVLKDDIIVEEMF